MSDHIVSNNKSKEKSDHLVIVGGGSAAFAAAIKASELNARVTMINDGLPLGGTCVNVGCVPSKTLIRAAETVHRANNHGFAGIKTSGQVDDFKMIMANKRALVEQLRQAKYIDVVAGLPGFSRIDGRAEIISPNMVTVNGKRISADKILIATGATTKIPEISGLDKCGYLTSATALDLDELPESLIVLGGRYIALEMAQMFSRFGSRVTILQRSSRILPQEMEDLTGELTRYLTGEGIEIVTGVAIEQAFEDSGDTIVEAVVDGDNRTFKASQLLVATGRKANTHGFGLDTAGVELDGDGFLKVNDSLQTNVENIYGAGDVTGEPMFVYTAAYEGALAAENAFSGSMKKRNYAPLPWVIFTDPQVAGVGLDESAAQKEGINAESSVLSLSHVPRSLAARDTRGFIKLVRDTDSDKLIGARIVAPEGSELLMEVTLAIKHGITVKEIISAFHPYLTLSEGVKLAAITFGKSVEKLSCCAV
ncbi:Mercuric ion reductase [hydrothermal vent metagenome]|uniref:Mercuric reductase n=1 Tax=hydrothermal vent metagenome TaxID=652676 RepID=A0A3B1BP12_9ZZZZ